jgi:integrase
MQAFINDRIQDGSAPASIKGDVELLAAAIRKIITNGRAVKILEKMKGFTLPKSRKRDNKWLKPEQVDKFIEALPQGLRFMVELQYWCGARISEIRDLRWEQVNFSTCCLEYSSDDIKEGDSTGDGKTIYIGEEMTRTLYEMHKNAPKDSKGNLLRPWVFLNDSKRNKIDQADFYRQWNATCLALGGEFVTVDKDGKTVQAWTSHDMRRARVTAQVKKGFDLKTISKQTGHHSIRMLEQYIKADSDDVRAMVDNQRQSDRELTEKLNKVKARLKEVWEVETDETKKAWLEDIMKDI